MSTKGGSEYMTYGGDEYYGGGNMDDIIKLLTTHNVIVAIVLVVLIIVIYNNMTNSSRGSSGSSASSGSPSYNGSNAIYIPNRINKLENSEYVYGSGTSGTNTDPVSTYYTFAPA